MNDISFSVATTTEQGSWNAPATGSYTMQATTAPYSEYLSLPFKLEPGTTANNTINTSNQQVNNSGLSTSMIIYYSVSNCDNNTTVQHHNYFIDIKPLQYPLQ